MKRIYLLRNADWDFTRDTLTQTGIDRCRRLEPNLPTFAIVISSEKERSIQTAKILSKKDPQVDTTIGMLNFVGNQFEDLKKIKDAHPLGVGGALFDIPNLGPAIKEGGEKLLDAARSTFSKLKNDECALLITHVGPLIAAEKILKKKSFDKAERTYDELEGFVVDEHLHLLEYM